MRRALTVTLWLSILCLVVIATSLPAQAAIPDVRCTVVPGENQTEFSYVVKSQDYMHLLKGFSVFAPINPTYLSTKQSIWMNELVSDGSGGAYIYWYAANQAQCLYWGDAITLTLYANVPITVVNNYTWGANPTNWGFDMFGIQTLYAGTGSMPVPLAVPEPCGLSVLALGLMALLRRRR